MASKVRLKRLLGRYCSDAVAPHLSCSLRYTRSPTLSWNTIRLVSPVSVRSRTTTPASRASTSAAWVPRVPEAPRKRDMGRKLMPEVESVRLVRLAVENDTSAPQSPQVSLARNENFGSVSSEMELNAPSAEATSLRPV